MPSDPILVHACCAPCLCGLVGDLRAKGTHPTAFFHNPNIHPLIEFRRRLKACQVLAEREHLPLIVEGAYGLEEFLDAIGTRRGRPERCRVCYALRVEATARYAAGHGFPRFTSTLLASPQQDRAALCELGHEAALRHGVAFDDSDYRSCHEPGMERARQLQLYRQQYCGCMFSEYERYCSTTEHLYRAAPRPQAAD
jgi:hypothetical protein